MFKILTLEPGVDAQLQAIQDQYEIDAVQNLGTDSTFNHYLLVQYNTAPSNPLPQSAQKEALPAVKNAVKKDDVKPVKGK